MNGSTVSEIRVEIGTARWCTTTEVRTITLAANQVVTTNNETGKRATVEFTVEVDYPARLSAQTMVVFRDSSGAVVEGTGNSSSGYYPPGSSRRQILTYAPLPDTADVTRTEVYVYPPRSAYLIT